MKKRYFLAVSLIYLLSPLTFAIKHLDSPPGAIRLLPDYQHKAEQGIDTRVGKIWKDGGLTIIYDIGRLAGRYATPTERDKYIWFKEQTFDTKKVWIAMTKERKLLITFPDDSANFYADIKSEEDVSDMLLMVLTYDPQLRDSNLRHSMKGYELYTWQSNGEQYFSLLVGTNRLKTRREVTSAEVRLKGIKELKRRLDQLPKGEEVILTPRLMPEMSVVPDKMLAEIRSYCKSRGLVFKPE